MSKICMVVDNLYRVDPRLRRYAYALADAGIQVDILCVRDTGPTSHEPAKGVRIFTIPIGRTYGGAVRHLLQYAAALFLFSAWLLALYIRNRYAVIHVHNMPDFLVLTALIPKLLGAKVILDVHDPMTEFFMTRFKVPRAGNVILQLLRAQEKWSAALAHVVITVSAEAKEILIKNGIPADKITVVRNLPDPKIFDRHKYEQERRTNRECFTLIYAGTVMPRYGLDVAIRALPLLRDKIPHIRLLIIGCVNEPPGDLVKLTEALGVSAFVRFQPLIPIGEVPRQLAGADIGIYPAVKDPYMNMAIPTKVLEYVAMGLPVVASRLAVLEGLFSDSALAYFVAGDAADFARSVLHLFDSSQRRDEMVRNADTVLAGQLSWSIDRQVYLDLLNHLLPPPLWIT